MSDSQQSFDAHEDHVEQAADTGELSEDDLENVAGGTSEWNEGEGQWHDGTWTGDGW